MKLVSNRVHAGQGAGEEAVKLRRYRVTATVTISVNTVVKAHSRVHAKRLAEGRGMMSLCYQCADGEHDVEWVTGGELDGEPKNLVAEEEEAQ